MILSTGMATEQEIEEAVTAARKSGCKELVLLHCISSYPTPIDQAHLRQISALAGKFKVPIGLSDHTLGTTAAVAAVALGACVIEKHFTLSRADQGLDCEFSLEPQELKRLCQEVKEAWSALGSHGFSRQKAEEGSKVFRRSLRIVKDIKAGEKLTRENLRRIRPGNGISAKEYERILGKRVTCDIPKGVALIESHLLSAKP
jgi:N-acetylneuraminate synthase